MQDEPVDLTIGNIWANIWYMSWPMLIIMLLNFLVGVVDVYVAGLIGPEVQAAVGFISQILFLTIIIANAISAATRDPRFSTITPDELQDLDYSVDVLTTPEPVPDESFLDPKKYGVIVEEGWRRGLLLPDLEGVDNVDYQIDICRQKGGISPDEPVQLYRFEVKRYK